MQTLKQFRSRLLAAAVVIGLTSLSANAMAAKGGKPGGETLGNNLSVPAKFVPNTTGAPALRIPCGTYAEPGGDDVPPSTVYEGYWLQKTTATWSADCIPAAISANVIAKEKGDATLKEKWKKGTLPFYLPSSAFLVEKGDATLLFAIFCLSWSSLWTIFQLASNHFPQPLNKTRVTAG